MKPFCNNFWGSHGCDLPLDHEGNHVCIIGFELDDDTRYEEVCCENDGTHVIHENGSQYESPVFSISV